MANEQHIESLEQAKKLAEETVQEMEQTLLKMKQEASSKVKEIDDALNQARQQVSVQEPSAKVSNEPTTTPVETPKAVKSERPVETPKKVIEDKDTKKEEEKERIEKLLKSRENEKQQIAELKKNLEKRTKGDKPAEPGNTGIKHTNAEVFIYIVDDNPLQLKVLLEKFKTTKSFKTAKGFTNGEDCLQYIKKHKYPKNSMIMAVVDYYLDDKGNGEESNTGIDVLHILKDYDSDIEVIVLSGSDDVDIAASATHFGAVSFVKKGEDDFKKIVNNIVWAIHEKAKVRKVAETQNMIKKLSLGIGIFTILSFGIYFIYMYLDSLK
jgi:FixJ family two-component response regulator